MGVWSSVLEIMKQVRESMWSRKECAANEKWEELSKKGTMDVKVIGVRSGVTRGIIFWIFWRQIWLRKMVKTLGRYVDYGWWHGKWKISIFVILEDEMIDKWGY